jgi:hypothetical protein
MIVKYKILKANQLENTVEVRFYTEAISETELAVQMDDNGNILRCRSDYNLQLPFPAPVSAALNSYILAHAPVSWLENLERSKLGILNPTISDVISLIGLEITQEQVTPLTPAETLTKAKEKATTAINTYRESVLSAGVIFKAQKFDSDTLSVTRLTAVATAIAAGAQLPANFTWRSADNVDVSMTATEIVSLLSTMIMVANEIYKVSWAKKLEIAAASTLAELEAITWSVAGVS